MSKLVQTVSNEKDVLLQHELAALLADLHQPPKILACLQLFLSETELSIFAKRLAIFKRLQAGQSYETIQKDLAVSSATISAVAQLRKNNFSEVIEDYINAKDWAENTAHNLRNLFNRKKSSQS